MLFNFFLIDQERVKKVEHFYRKLRYSQMHSNPGATLKIPRFFNMTTTSKLCEKGIINIWKT